MYTYLPSYFDIFLGVVIIAGNSAVLVVLMMKLSLLSCDWSCDISSELLGKSRPSGSSI